MAEIDLSVQFEKISDTAKTASDKLKSANLRTRDQLETDVVRARDKATAAEHQFEHEADDAHSEASSQWQDIRDRWQADVAKARAAVEKNKAQLDVTEAMMDAGEAEAYALEAIDFAQDAIEEAEYATLAAMSARAKADALSS